MSLVRCRMNPGFNEDRTMSAWKLVRNSGEFDGVHEEVRQEHFAVQSDVIRIQDGKPLAELHEPECHCQPTKSDFPCLVRYVKQEPDGMKFRIDHGVHIDPNRHTYVFQVMTQAEAQDLAGNPGFQELVRGTTQ